MHSGGLIPHEMKQDEVQSQIGGNSMKNVNFAQEVETVHESTVPASNHQQGLESFQIL